MKTCTLCGEDKPLDDFYNDGRKEGRKLSRCKTCITLYNNKWRENNKDRSRAAARNRYKIEPLKHKVKRIKSKYGISEEKYLEMLTAQGNKCAICRTHFDELHMAHTDHCHTTGKVRGILCFTCNRGIGLFKDNPDFLYSAARYLENNT